MATLRVAATSFALVGKGTRTKPGQLTLRLDRCWSNIVTVLGVDHTLILHRGRERVSKALQLVLGRFVDRTLGLRERKVGDLSRNVRVDLSRLREPRQDGHTHWKGRWCWRSVQHNLTVVSQPIFGFGELVPSGDTLGVLLQLVVVLAQRGEHLRKGALLVHVDLSRGWNASSILFEKICFREATKQSFALPITVFVLVPVPRTSIRCDHNDLWAEPQVGTLHSKSCKGGERYMSAEEGLPASKTSLGKGTLKKWHRP